LIRNIENASDDDQDKGQEESGDEQESEIARTGIEMKSGRIIEGLTRHGRGRRQVRLNKWKDLVRDDDGLKGD
jgi:hypothetical protein